MVKRFALCLALAFAGQAWALTAQLDHKTLALGEPLTLSLSGHAATLDAIDLAPLQGDFEVFARTLSQSETQGILQLTLYPLKTGRLTIPALGGGRERSRPLAVEVTSGSSDMPAVRMRLYTEPAQPWVRQATRLTLELCDDGSLQWQRPKLPLSGQMQQRALGEEQIEIEQDGVRCTAQRYHWAVLPTQAGVIRVELPTLEASKFGRRLRLPPPVARFAAAPVPAWLPLNVPVGKPSLKAEALPETWPLQRPLAWRFTVEGGYSVDGLKALLALQLQPHATWRAYPPTVESLAPEDRNSPLTHLAVTLHALPDTSGPLAAPKLALPYFDPGSARLEQLALALPPLQVYDPFWRKLGQTAALVAGALALLVLLQWLYREWQWRRRRDATLLAIENAADPAELGLLLRGFSLSPRPAAPTLGAWLSRMHGQWQGTAALADLVAALEARRYDLQYIPLADLKRQATTAIAGLRPRTAFTRHRRQET